jgi:ubiquinone/menaquinone biosynthesis C-methylase UbiE
MPTANTFSGHIPQNYHKYLGPFLFEPFAEDLGGRLHFSKPVHVLELACGTGRATRHILNALPPHGSVVATDCSTDMLLIGKEEIDDKRITWQETDAHELPFDDHTFDHVVCQFGIMFFEDKLKVLSEVYRVLKPGGKFLFNTWDSLEKNTGPALVNDIMQETFGKDAPDFFEQGPYSFCDPDEIESLVTEAGFTDVKIEAVAKTNTADDERIFIKGFMEGTQLNEFFMNNDPVVREKIREKIIDALSIEVRGSLRSFHLQAWVIDARKT